MTLTFTTEQGIEYLYNLPNSKVDEEEEAEYGLILSRDEIETERYSSGVISFLNQLPKLRVITEKDFIDKTQIQLMDFFNDNPVDALNMDSQWITKFMMKNYQVLKYIDGVFDILVDNKSSFCNINHNLLFSILGQGYSYHSNYVLYRKVKDPNSTSKTKKVLHSICCFNFENKNLVIDSICVNNHLNFRGAGALLNILMDMGVYLKTPNINLHSMDTIHTMVFYIKNSLVPESFRNINKITYELQLTPMKGVIDIRIRPNWKLNRIVDKTAANATTLPYSPPFSLSPTTKLPVVEPVVKSPSPLPEKEKTLYEKYRQILTLIKSTISGITYRGFGRKHTNNDNDKEPIIFSKEELDLFREKMIETKEKNKVLIHKHNEKLREMKKLYKEQFDTNNKPQQPQHPQQPHLQQRQPPQPPQRQPLQQQQRQQPQQQQRQQPPQHPQRQPQSPKQPKNNNKTESKHTPKPKNKTTKNQSMNKE